MPTRDSLAAYLGGGGQMVDVVVPAPGAGLNIAPVLVPANVEWRLVAGTFLFSASGVAANRNIFIRQLNAGGDFLYDIWAGETVVANGAARWTFGQLGYQSVNIPAFLSRVALGSSDYRLVEGDTVLTTAVSNLQAGDAFTAIGLRVEQWSGLT